MRPSGAAAKRLAEAEPETRGERSGDPFRLIETPRQAADRPQGDRRHEIEATHLVVNEPSAGLARELRTEKVESAVLQGSQDGIDRRAVAPESDRAREGRRRGTASETDRVGIRSGRQRAKTPAADQPPLDPFEAAAAANAEKKRRRAPGEAARATEAEAREHQVESDFETSTKKASHSGHGREDGKCGC